MSGWVLLCSVAHEASLGEGAVSHYLNPPQEKWPHNICQSQGFIYLSVLNCSYLVLLRFLAEVYFPVLLIDWLVSQFEQWVGKESI